MPTLNVGRATNSQQVLCHITVAVSEVAVYVSKTMYQGTHFYISPEQKKKESYGKMVDVYALGIIYFEMNCPFGSEKERREVIIHAFSLVV